MLGRILFFGLCIFLSNGFSFNEEATSLLQTQGIDLSGLAAASTSSDRKDALQAALNTVRKQLAQQVTDVKSDFDKRETARVKARDEKLAAAGKAKAEFEAALKTYQTLKGLSDKADETYKIEKEDDLEETNRLTTNVDTVVRTLTELLNGKPVTWNLDGWTGWVNGWDGPLNQGTDQTRAFCGFGGVHDNNKEDRLFKVRRCRPVTSGQPQSVSNQQELKLPKTEFQQHWLRQCPHNQYISSLYSIHNNGKEDREWTIGCKSFEHMTSRACSWTGWLNGYDGAFYFNCPNGNVLGGIKGEYSAPHRDRRFSAMCCETRRSVI
jgi:Skp family chaperone for outer membrane proteins